MNGGMENGLLRRLALAALAAALALAAAVGCGGAPVGQEAFRHDVGGEIFVFVEYGDEIAVFDGAGRPVSSRQAADGALRSYAWTRALDDSDVSGLARVSDRTGELDSDIDDARSASNAVVDALDELEGVGASIPLMGRVSAMDLVESAYPGVGALDGAMRGLDATLNDWGADSDNLSDAAARLQALSHSPHPDADEVESAFQNAVSAARGLADTIGEIESSLGKAREGVSRLVGALRSASGTPVIGDGLDWLADEIDEEADYALSGLAASLGSLKGDLNAVSTGFGAGAAQAETAFSEYADRWTDSPPDASWPPADPERRSPPRPDPTPRALASLPPAAPPAPAASAAPARLATATPFAPPAPESSSSSGGRIAFGSHKDGDFEIYAMSADGSGLAQLTNNRSHDFDPSLSPDGRRIAFVSNRDGDSNYEIYAMSADGSNQTRLTNNSAKDYDPSWSPDGRRIAFTSERDGNNEVYAMNADGSGVARLTNDSARDTQPSWSPDSRRIAFVSSRDGNEEIYAMNADGSNQTRLTNSSAGDDATPSWSPDGQRIAFASDRDGNWEIYAMSADGSNQTRLTNRSSATDAAPSWSPDGRRIAFESEGIGSDEIYAMNADGSGVMRLTNNSVDVWGPSWAPQPRVGSVAPQRTR